MRRKTLLLAAGALALTVSIVMAQSAVAVHETVKSTNAMTGSVVPAYEECTAPNTFHAAPVSFPSCSTSLGTKDISALLRPKAHKCSNTSYPATVYPCTGTGNTLTGFTSSYSVQVCYGAPSGGATAGTPACPGAPNGFGTADPVDTKVVNTGTGTLCEKPSLFLAAVRLANCPKPGAPSTVCSDTTANTYNGCPFNGDVIGESDLWTTDANNCTAPCTGGTFHATVEEFTFSFLINCTAGNCNITSTADAQFGCCTYPPTAGDATPKGKLADIEIRKVRVMDPGPNGTVGTGCPLTCRDGDEKEAAAQGIFIP